MIIIAKYSKILPILYVFYPSFIRLLSLFYKKNLSILKLIELIFPCDIFDELK